MSDVQRTTLYVVPCGASKTGAPAPARYLYTSAHFHYVLDGLIMEAARRHADDDTDHRVMILSAMHGLVDLDTVIAPYDMTMKNPASITGAALADQLRTITRGQGMDIYAALPAAYLDRLNTATSILNNEPAPGALTHVFNLYEGTTGIGGQRHVIATLGRL